MTKSPKIQVQLKDGQLLPITEYDAEKLEDAKNGQVYNLSATGQRSNPHHNKYWVVLRRVCAATGKWPDAEHLHDEIKYACGYYRLKYSSLAGQFLRIPDSISFDEMTQQEFNEYFDMAMHTLAEDLGYDPLQTS